MICLNPPDQQRAGRRDCWLVEHTHELPDVSRARILYADFETRSGDRKRPGDNPWAGDRICGAAVTRDDDPNKYYVAVRHTDPRFNVPVDAFQRWLRDGVETCGEWVNHNVKFDAHFAHADGATFRGRLGDTLTKAKLIDSDRGFGRGGYGLDALSSDWLENDIDPHDQAVQAQLKMMKSKDYADCPTDVMAWYACQDVDVARQLNAYCEEQRRVWSSRVLRFDLCWQMEMDLTPVLWDVEQEGLRVDPQELRMTQLRLLTQMHVVQEELHRLVGFAMDPANTGDCYELVVNRLGLPVLAWTDERRAGADHNPSFDKEALQQYLQHPEVVADERLTHVFERLLFYRKRNTLLTFFVDPYIRRQVGGILHPQYNQIIRTGRMSSKQPNAQQLSKEAKALVHPDPGTAFLSCDGSQIEFRLICHYSQDRAVLDAYARDPDTDFHQWVADMVQCERDPAKTVNFCIGYGGGKAKVQSQLASNMQLMKQMAPVVDQLIASGQVAPEKRRLAFEALCQRRAEDVYNTYHRTLPGIRRVTRHAAMLVKQTGFVCNEYGRVRRLPEKAAWRALNSLTQGMGSDILKYAMVKTAPRYCAWTRDAGMRVKADVHDEYLSQWPREALQDPQTVARFVNELEDVPVPLRVPIRFGAGVSDKDWREAGSKGCRVLVDRDLAREAA